MAVTLIVLFIWIFSVCLHEFGHAITAYIAGDKSVKEKGYLTLNPMVYFNSVTTLIIPVFILMIGGIPLPGAAVAINTKKIKSRIWLSVVSFAGPLFTFLFTIALAVAVNLLAVYPDIFGDPKIFATVYSSLVFLIFLHVFVLILNLLPLPPLDGYGIIEPWLPKEAQHKIREKANLGFLLLIILFFVLDAPAKAMTEISIISTALLGANLKALPFALNEFNETSKMIAVVLIVAWIFSSRFQSSATRADNELRKQNYEEALKYYLEAKEKSKDDTRLDIAIATCLLSLKRMDESYEFLDNVLRVEPENIKAISLKAACLSEQNRYQEAAKLLESIPEDDEEGLTFPYIVKTSTLIELKNFESALATIDECLKIDPKDPNALQLKAECLEKMNQYEQAIDVYTFMARTKGGFQTACIFKGLLLIAMGKEEEGFENFKKVLSLNEKDREDDKRNLKKLLMDKAVKLNQEEKKEEAERLHAAARKLMEGDPFAS